MNKLTDLKTIQKSKVFNLKCALCKNYLSYFPIHSTSNQNICGRCEKPSSAFRNLVYEIVAQEQLFPCQFETNGCVEKFHPKKLPKHEKFCLYKPFSCLLCDKSTTSKDFTKHCTKSHSDLSLKNGQFKVTSGTNLIIEDNSVYFFKTKYNKASGILSYAVTSNHHTRQKYEITVKNSWGSCAVQAQVKNLTDLENYNEMSLAALKGAKDAPKATIKIGLDGVSTEVLELFKCTLCGKYIQPPISMFIRDTEIVCANCGVTKRNFKRKPTKNRQLNLLAETLNYPCENQKFGCTFTNKSHCCQYQASNCPLSDCNWNGSRREIVSHVAKQHCDLAANLPIFLINLSRRHNGKHLLRYGQYLFRLNFDFLENIFRWTVQMIGDYEDMFCYELEISDKLIVTQRCFPAADENLLFLDPREFGFLQLDQIEHLLDRNNLIFQIRIVVVDKTS